LRRQTCFARPALSGDLQPGLPARALCEGSCTHGGGVCNTPIQIGKLEKFVIELQYSVEGIRWARSRADPAVGWR